MPLTPEDEALVVETMRQYQISRAEAEVSVERRKVYGDPWINHRGIAMAWAGLLQPWASRIARMDYLPPHTVAMMMGVLKSNRTRMTFHDDNYVDANVYFAFARTWQREWEERGREKPIVIGPAPSRGSKIEIRWVEEGKQNEAAMKAAHVLVLLEKPMNAALLSDIKRILESIV